MLKLRTLLFRIIQNIARTLIVFDSLSHRCNQQWNDAVCRASPALQAVPCHCWFESLLAARWSVVSCYYGAKFPDFQRIDMKAQQLVDSARN